jgi:hypothetical protein
VTEPTAGWEPANDTERALLKALTEDDRVEFFRILATSPLYLPQVSADDGADEQTFITGELFGHTMLPVYTSIEALIAAVDGVADAYTTTNYAELRERWPHPEWRLAVNPGFPIDAYLAIDELAKAASGTVQVPTVGELIVDGAAGDEDAAMLLDIDAALLGAMRRGDPGAYIDTLLDAMVVVPTARPVEDPEQLVNEEHLWRAAGTPEAPVIEVFTSAETFHAAFPGTVADVPSVTMPLVLLLGVWPDGCALAVNPRTDLAIDLPAEQVVSLLLWTPEDESDLDGEQPGEPTR